MKYRFDLFIARIVILTLLSGLALDASSAQQPETARRMTSLALGLLKSPPDNQVFVPIVLSVSEEIEIGTIFSTITFPNGVLSFEGITKGASAEAVEGEVEALVRMDEETSGFSVLDVVATSPKGKAIPAGVVAYLAFKVSAEAPLQQAIPLKNAARALTTDDPPKPFDSLEARSGEIEVKVSDNPFYACFFYMH